ncbi:DUF2785 domain-containing protein [Inconstantimicrobium mannanitabidum]|uniref:Membrane protein n=1 Tax=Inconstantimicrobium mannanitabidum TaxID=1604901 RepID=A0ACB5RGA6_9CLOT|nr:DUF2785 domain-containing protein [Clostridium sp. TW13]GKX68129.1 membrane protein [Clostridium sp. TW13]
MTSKEKELKEKLTKIKNNNYILDGEESYFKLALEMMENIGSTDPELRDELIYGILFNWIIENKLVQEQLKELLSISLDKAHVFYKLGDNGEDSVFTRTFSVLIVALIIYKHNQEAFLSEEELHDVKDKLVEYMLKEQDIRGYVEVKGWAHSAAHTSDALDELAQCDCFNKEDLLDILNSIKIKACTGYYVYIDEESERMVNAIENSFKRKLLSESEIKEWLNGFTIKNAEYNYMQGFHSKVNIKDFLRSLYFRLLEQEEYKSIVEEIKNILNSKTFNRY